MCRTTDYGGYHPQQRLKITGFHLRLSLSSPSTADLLPDSLTLLLLPRINAAPLHLNGSKIPSDSPAFLSLHRVLPYDDAIFSSADRLRVSDGLSFEVHVAGSRLLKGIFRRDDDLRGRWTVECKCAGVVAGFDVGEAEVTVSTENSGVLRDKVTVRRCRRRGFTVGLVDIPEERDECCCCSDGDGEDDDREDELDGEDDGREDESDGVGWAVDVGFWVVCLGVGLFVSSRRLRRRKFLT